MKEILSMTTILGICCAVSMANPTDLTVTSLDHNGNINWSNILADASYQIEWTSSLISPEWTDSWESLLDLTGTNTILTAKVPMFYRVVGTTPRTFKFADYQTDDPNIYIRKEFRVKSYELSSEWTVSGDLKGTMPIPYTSGTIVGYSNSISPFIYYNDGEKVKLLGLTFPGGGTDFFSTDSIMTSHPENLALGNVYDGMYFTESFFDIEDGISLGPDNKKIFVQIEDVTIPSGTYTNSIVLWHLDDDQYFSPEFYGEDALMGISIPTIEQARSNSFTRIEIYAESIGLIVAGDIDSDTADLVTITKITEYVP